MISLTIKDTKNFMSQLLIKETFDTLYISEADISTAITSSINGSINKDYYTNEEYEQLSLKKYSTWSTVKPICFDIIKGKKVPSSMKIVFILPENICESIISYYSLPFSLSDISALCINVRYINGNVTITTGSSLNIFTLDKAVDNALDDYIKKFLDNASIDFEEFN